MENVHFWYWLANISGIGLKTSIKLLNLFFEPEGIYFASSEELLNTGVLNEKQIKDILISKDEEKIIKDYEKLSGFGVSFIHYGMEEYPERLNNIEDPPIALYVKGSLPDEMQKSVAIIGARSSTNYGREMARLFGRELAKAGVSVISGLARGIDGCGHRGAIEGNGYTAGVLGCGIDMVYPKENYDLFMKMESVGGIISEYNIGVKPEAWHFPARNRIISALSDGILVVEAMEKSGTFITVDQGLSQGKEVFALPGRIIDQKSRGCNELIKMGAHPVTDVSDILSVLGQDSEEEVIKNLLDNEKRVEKSNLAPNEKMVYSCLHVEPEYIDDIVNKVRLSPQEVSMILNRLSLLDIINETGRNYYAVKI